MKVRGWWFVVGGALALLLGISLSAQNRAAQVPMFEPDPLWAQALPNKWATGAVGGIAVDSHDNVWVFQRPATIPESSCRCAMYIRQRDFSESSPAAISRDLQARHVGATNE